MAIMILYAHIICAFSSLSLLLIRGIMQWCEQSWRKYKLLKVLPHLVDTLLILSGIWLWWIFSLGYPLWLLAKLVALAIYIIFAAKSFHKNVVQFSLLNWVLACLGLIVAILLGYFH